MSATRRIIGVGPTTRVSANLGRQHCPLLVLYIKNTHCTEQQNNTHSCLTPPSIDESPLELFDIYDLITHPKLATQLVTDYLSTKSDLSQWRDFTDQQRSRSNVPLGSILETKPLRQGQKARILGRGSQSCSHLYSTLPVPSQQVIPPRPALQTPIIDHSTNSVPSNDIETDQAVTMDIIKNYPLAWSKGKKIKGPLSCSFR